MKREIITIGPRISQLSSTVYRKIRYAIDDIWNLEEIENYDYINNIVHVTYGYDNEDYSYCCGKYIKPLTKYEKDE